MGLLLGWRMAAKIPNLERSSVAGWCGRRFHRRFGLSHRGYGAARVHRTHDGGRGVGDGALAIVLVEQWFRVASLEVKWALKETTTVNLGSRPVMIGGGDDHVYLTGLPEHAMSVVLEQGRIFVTEVASGRRTEPVMAV